MSIGDNQPEPLSEDEYAEASNKMSIMLAQLGVDTSEVQSRLVDSIIEACDGFTSELEVESKANELYGLIFHEQIEGYINGASYFVKTFKEYGESLGLKLKIVNVDEISVNADTSHEYIIESTTKLLSILIEHMTSINEESAETFRTKINLTISMYMDTSFILGLTDAKSLNYFANKAEGVEIGELIKLLEEVFPRIF